MQISTKNRRLRIAAVVLAVIFLGCAAGIYAIAASIYDSNFDRRYTTGPADAYSIEDFPHLYRSRHTFISDKGQTLVGYLYSSKILSARKHTVVVFAHGLGGGGQRGYMDIFDRLAAQGYDIFAYGATANDESEGKAVGGLPQGVIDLSHALDYISTLEGLQEHAIVLMGYSWGAYSVANVLNDHPDVAAVAMLSGFNRSTDLMEDRGRKIASDAVGLLMPFAFIHEYRLFGRYAFFTAMKGFDNSSCRVMVVHGDRDTTVPIRYGLEAFEEKYGENERFTFKRYPGRDHCIIENSVGWRDMELIDEIARFFDTAVSEEQK